MNWEKLIKKKTTTVVFSIITFCLTACLLSLPATTLSLRDAKRSSGFYIEGSIETYPETTFFAAINDLFVFAEAEEGTFPEGTVM